MTIGVLIELLQDIQEQSPLGEDTSVYFAGEDNGFESISCAELDRKDNSAVIYG